MALLKVSEPSKARVEELQAERQAALGRTVTQAEVVEWLLAEHDRNREQVTP
jgi:hypothetical protein